MKNNLGRETTQRRERADTDTISGCGNLTEIGCVHRTGLG